MSRFPEVPFRRAEALPRAKAKIPADLFHRRELALSFADALMSAVGRKGMLLSGPRQIGKSTFVQWDLIPVLEEVHDAHVVYIDLAVDLEVDPSVSIPLALRDEVRAFDGLVMRMARGLGLTNIRLGGLEMAVEQAQSTYSKRTFGLLQTLARACRRPLVIVLDEVQLCQQSDPARRVLASLTRSAIRLNREGLVVRVLATGSHAHKLRKLVANKQEAFYSAHVRALPRLGDDFVDWVRARLAPRCRPDADLMVRGFDTLLHRPLELMDVCDALRDTGVRSQSAADQVYQLLVDERSTEGREQLIARMRTLSALELALVRVMAETGPRFAPHLMWCKQRTAALIEVMQGVPPGNSPSTSEIDAALDGLAGKEIIWRGLGFAFEEQRYAAWILAMNPATDFQVEFDESSAMPGERPGLIAPALLS
ncbi:hypothetical protein CDL60_03415 [Roseateles noduli]|nr:hypothetical protein CDL60_03415 [Roseateles noduli]